MAPEQGFAPCPYGFGDRHAAVTPLRYWLLRVGVEPTYPGVWTLVRYRPATSYFYKYLEYSSHSAIMVDINRIELMSIESESIVFPLNYMPKVQLFANARQVASNRLLPVVLYMRLLLLITDTGRQQRYSRVWRQLILVFICNASHYFLRYISQILGFRWVSLASPSKERLNAPDTPSTNVDELKFHHHFYNDLPLVSLLWLHKVLAWASIRRLCISHTVHRLSRENFSLLTLVISLLL